MISYFHLTTMVIVGMLGVATEDWLSLPSNPLRFIFYYVIITFHMK